MPINSVVCDYAAVHQFSAGVHYANGFDLLSVTLSEPRAGPQDQDGGKAASRHHIGRVRTAGARYPTSTGSPKRTDLGKTVQQCLKTVDVKGAPGQLAAQP